ncbi:probable serine/threonine-protein kinase samkC [Peromyscus californicus insignis]|uniref:probable serine/threonine-protein kinase samkC n=1 Tax=Peromyscus californicus insignis TaxID=564181 RepID=UPI0022A72B84|nr:probable serine/threonine-protein kinase samkC [Peromyscus californicus insignis]
MPPSLPPKPKPKSPSRADRRSPARALQALYFGSQTLGSNLSAQRPSGSRDREVATNFPGPSPSPPATSQAVLVGIGQGEMDQDRMLSGLQIQSATFPLHPAPRRLPGTRAHEAAPFPRSPAYGFPPPPFSSKEGRPHDLNESVQLESARQVCERSRTPGKYASRPCPSLHQPSPPECLRAREKGQQDPGSQGAQSRPSRGRGEVWIGSASSENGGEWSKRPRA